ncbi:MAG: TonB-dependent receptor [Bacteroidota bacterium]|nr:TonB-dependent receptor [Bacteroidota bacterium]
MKINNPGYQLILFFSFMLLSTGGAYSQTRISGFVRDKDSGELLIGANIVNLEKSKGTVSDNNGFFSIVVKPPCSVQVSFVGYKEVILKIQSRQNKMIAVELETSTQLDAVVVKAKRQIKPNVSTLSSKELQQIPTLGGKPDVLKSMQLLPGIQSQNEGTSRLIVRGGDPGQNLYLFDDVPVIYVNHLGGFMSVFNPDIITSIDLYKGGFPARFGGRLSSVVDITQREGDQSSLKGSFSIGITDASFTVEGPLKMKNTNFIVTGRKTMIDALMASFSRISEGNDFVVAYGFHDLNGKFTWKPDSHNSVHINLYQGDDYLNYWSSEKARNYKEKSRLKNVWGNWLTSARWNHVFSPRVFMTNSLSYSRYRLRNDMSFSVSDSSETTEFERKYLSSVEDLSLRSNLKFQILENWSASAGIQTSLLKHIPNNTYQTNFDIQPITEKLIGMESALFLNNIINLFNRLEANLGLRGVNYTSKNVQHFSLEPRVNLDFRISDNHHINMSYMKVSQNAQLLVTTGNIMNNEVWVPTDLRILPAQSEQVSLSWIGSFYQSMFDTELSVYHKTMNNLATYKEGFTNLIGDTDWRSKIIAGGKGESMGIEFLIRKSIGDWTGFASYAWSHTTRLYPEINKGLEYLYEFNRPHTASLNINRRFNDKWSLNLTWVYQTGLPYTPVVGRQYTLNTKPDANGNFGYYEALLYGERNSAHMKNYHRLDVGVTYNTVTRNNRPAAWTFSIYNLYNRHNPLYYYYNTDAKADYNRPQYWSEFMPTNLYQMSLFPIIPSVSYKVFFDENRIKRTTKKVRKDLKKQINPTPRKEKKWRIQAGYGVLNGLYIKGTGRIRTTYGNYRLESNYRILKFLGVGGYLGYSHYTTTGNPSIMPDFIYENKNIPYFGLNVNMHLMPLILKTTNTRFDVYLKTHYGGPLFHSVSENFIPTNGFYPKFGFGAGASFYLDKYVGIFAEYEYAKKISPTQKTLMRFGVICKF